MQGNSKHCGSRSDRPSATPVSCSVACPVGSGRTCGIYCEVTPAWQAQTRAVMACPLKSSLIALVKVFVSGWRLRRVQGSLRSRSILVAACWRQMVDRPKWSSRSSSLRLMAPPRSEGRPDPGHASRQDASVKSVMLLCCYASAWFQRNGVFVFHMAWRMTASFRATATRAFLKPDALASFMPHAFSVENRRLRVSSVVAAS